MLSTTSKSQFGEEIYRLMERMLETKAPVEIEFKGKKFLIGLVQYFESGEDTAKLARLEPHPGCLVGDPEDIVHIDWSGEIHNDLP